MSWRYAYLPLLILVAVCLQGVDGYHHPQCKSRSVRAQFQFPDCYVPPHSTSILLSDASFLMSHDSATGYIHSGGLSKNGLSWPYSKTQVGTAYQQLSDGARALDLRPKLLANGTVVFQHGAIQIPISLYDFVADVIRWCGTEGQDNELVLLLASNFAYEQVGYQNNDDNDEDTTMFSAMKEVYEQLGVTYLHCSDVYGLTVGDALELGALSSGGYLLAIDGQDYYGTFCGKSNWVEDQLVTCWDKSESSAYGKQLSCKSGSLGPLERLTDYVLASANNPTTNNANTLGPPENPYQYPFNEIQALWQVDGHSVAVGMAHFSSILDDNRVSKVNQHMVKLVHEEKLNAISLFAVDNVALNGNALLSVLRNSCGQTDLSVCGREIEPPKLFYWHVTRKGFVSVLAVLYLAFLVYSVVRLKRPKLLYTLVARLQGHNSSSLSLGLVPPPSS